MSRKDRMQLDHRDTLADILSRSIDGLSFKQKMLDMAKHRIDKEQTTKWASNLRFLVSADSPRKIGLCATCDETPAFTSQETRLQLTEPGSAGNCHHYVAVSYCWQHEPSTSQVCDGASSCRGPRLCDKHQFEVEVRGETRKNKAPAEVIRRAICCAIDFQPHPSRIWIDQECIDQDDRMDKEFGIQSMDQVYHNANWTLGLLNTTIETQAEMDILECLIEHRELSSEQVGDAVNLMHRFSQDRWFGRCWIFQESSLALNMRLMAKCDKSLVKPAVCGRIEGEVCFFGIDALQRLAQATLACANRNSHRMLITGLHKMEEIDWWSTSMYPQITVSADNTTKRFACSAAEAIHHLQFRQNSRPADRLAIVANLCQYGTRLDTTKIDTNSHSFSVALVTLAVINGDMSLFIEKPRQRVNPAPQAAQFILQAPSFSWVRSLLPRSLYVGRWKHTSYQNVFDPNSRLQLCQLGPRGLRTSGWLWVVDRMIEIPKPPNSLGSKLPIALVNGLGMSHVYDPLDAVHTEYTDIIKSAEDWASKMLYHILDSLLSQGQREVADTLWHLVRPSWHKQWGPGWARFRKQPEWRHCLDRDHNMSYLPEQYEDSFPGLLPSLDRFYEDDVQQKFRIIARDCYKAPMSLAWLLKRAYETCILPCGRIFHIKEGTAVADTTATTLFDCSDGTLVFTPYAEEICPVHGPVQPRVTPIAWAVALNHQESVPLEIECLSTVQGVWDFGQEPPMEIYLT
ncbi:hypothetical protein CIB48_g4550 [Xylaria polymorpha]|nr:hypothetical protein CIB48_g4550 [Xylaria polymorpha]